MERTDNINRHRQGQHEKRGSPPTGLDIRPGDDISGFNSSLYGQYPQYLLLRYRKAKFINLVANLS